MAVGIRDSRSATVSNPAGFVFLDGVETYDAKICAHCGFHWEHKPSLRKMRGRCGTCKGDICCRTQCSTPMGECMVFEAWLDKYEKTKFAPPASENRIVVPAGI